MTTRPNPLTAAQLAQRQARPAGAGTGNLQTQPNLQPSSMGSTGQAATLARLRAAGINPGGGDLRRPKPLGTPQATAFGDRLGPQLKPPRPFGTPRAGGPTQPQLGRKPLAGGPALRMQTPLQPGKPRPQLPGARPQPLGGTMRQMGRVIQTPEGEELERRMAAEGFKPGDPGFSARSQEIMNELRAGKDVGRPLPTLDQIKMNPQFSGDRSSLTPSVPGGPAQRLEEARRQQEGMSRTEIREQGRFGNSFMPRQGTAIPPPPGQPDKPFVGFVREGFKPGVQGGALVQPEQRPDLEQRPTPPQPEGFNVSPGGAPVGLENLAGVLERQLGSPEAIGRGEISQLQDQLRQSLESAQQQPAVNTGLEALLQDVRGQIANPTAFGGPEIQALRDQFRADLGAEGERRRSAIEADAARRGVTFSTVPGTRTGGLSDLAGSEARALSNFDAQILAEGARARDVGLQNALQNALGVGRTLQGGGQFERGLRSQEALGQAGFNLGALNLGAQSRGDALQRAIQNAMGFGQQAQQGRQFQQDLALRSGALASQGAPQISDMLRNMAGFGLDQGGGKDNTALFQMLGRLFGGGG